MPPSEPADTFADLYRQYKNLIYKTALLMLGDPGEADDALQEVFVRVMQSWSAYDSSKGAVTTWLYRITVNYCLNRRRDKRPTLSLDEHHVIDGRQNGTHRVTELQVERDEALRSALFHLSPKLRATVVLRYYWDLSYSEIAEVLQIPIGTVRSRLNLAHRRLRRQLATGKGLQAEKREGIET